MGICRGTSTRYQFCGKDIPKYGNYPNVCGASPAVFNPNVPRDSGVAMSRAKTRRVIGNTSTKYVRSVDPNQVVSAVQMRLGQQPYNGKRGESSPCVASRSGGVGKMFGHGRAKRCFNTGCACGTAITDTPGNFSGTTPDASERTAALAAIADTLSSDIRTVQTENGNSFSNNAFSTGSFGNNSEGSCYNVTGVTVTRKVATTGACGTAQRSCNNEFNYSGIMASITCPADIYPPPAAGVTFDVTEFSGGGAGGKIETGGPGTFQENKNFTVGDPFVMQNLAGTKQAIGTVTSVGLRINGGLIGPPNTGFKTVSFTSKTGPDFNATDNVRFVNAAGGGAANSYNDNGGTGLNQLAPHSIAPAVLDDVAGPAYGLNNINATQIAFINAINALPLI